MVRATLNNEPAQVDVGGDGAVTAPISLAEFERPPVTSVRLSAAFDRLPKVRAAHAGLLWEELGGVGTLPEVEDLYVEPTDDEQFPAAHERPPFDVALLDRPRPTRTALRSADRTHSVELQDDEISFSWTQQPKAGEYPRYTHVRAEFVKVLDAWQRVVDRHALGSLRPRQAEVAYTNHLPLDQGWSGVEDVGTVLRLQWMPTSAAVPQQPEDLHVYQRYVLERDGQPYGRLYVSADTDRERNGTKAFALSLTVRGRPKTSDLDATLALLDEGHKIIVSTFVAVTTETMHERWGRSSS